MIDRWIPKLCLPQSLDSDNIIPDNKTAHVIVIQNGPMGAVLVSILTVKEKVKGYHGSEIT